MALFRALPYKYKCSNELGFILLSVILPCLTAFQDFIIITYRGEISTIIFHLEIRFFVGVNFFYIAFIMGQQRLKSTDSDIFSALHVNEPFENQTFRCVVCVRIQQQFYNIFCWATTTI